VKRSIMVMAVSAMALFGVLAGGSPASAYGGGATHETWQAGLSFNCNNPDYCGADGLGGFWGWFEFDRSADGSTTWGDAELAGCGHAGPGGGPHSAGAGHISVEVTSWHLGAPGPDDPPNVQMFYIDGNEVTYYSQGQKQTVDDDLNFLGDSGVPATPGHYSFHPAPGVAGVIQVAYRPAK